MQPQIHFFIGKGGVGKSTVSALTALHFAQSGLDTLLVSMDPAHNQGDLFEVDLREKPRKILKSLHVKEVDVDFWIGKYLAETREQLRKSYLYQSAFNLQTHFKVLQYSPGLEEYALLMAFEAVLRQEADKDAIIFDMAPTALSLRFFSLPGITLLWLAELLKLRNLICQKKEIISLSRETSKSIACPTHQWIMRSTMKKHAMICFFCYSAIGLRTRYFVQRFMLWPQPSHSHRDG